MSPEAERNETRDTSSHGRLPLTISVFPTTTPKGPAFGVEVATDWAAFVERLKGRRIGAKDGACFATATFKPEPDGQVRRLKENVVARTAIAMDFESHKLTGETPPAFTEAVARVAAQGWAGIVYTSHNHEATAPRYRIVLPLSETIDAELPAVEVIAGIIRLYGVLDTGKIGASSLFYFPSTTKARSAEHATIVLEGTPLDAAWMRETAGAIAMAREAERAHQHAEALAEADKRRQEKIQAGYDPTHSLIEEIRQRLDLTGELLKNGYKQVGKKFLAPESSSGVPGVYLLRGSDGVERVYSHHASDLLAAGNLPNWCTVKAVDAVDVVVIREYGGNLKRGLHALAKRFSIASRRRRDTPREPPSRPDGEPASPPSEPPPDQDFDAEIDALVVEFNERYFVVNENGSATIFQPGYDPILKRRHFDRLSPRDLNTLYMNRLLQVGIDEKGRSIWKNASEIWLRHRDRRQFIDGVMFDPGTTTPKPGVLNLWQGFAVKPKPGNWSLLHEHINKIICDGDRKRFDYLMGWMARMLQRPDEQGEVAVVMKGGEGTGKGTLAKALLKIMGQHGLAISNVKHLVGNFNGHLRDAILLFADEAFFAGDKAHVGTLKSLITEPYLTVEAKFQNAVQMPNFLHVMMASNEEWVVPASLDARRFFVLEVSERVKSDHGYFAALWAQMEAGGYEAMLHDLLVQDLTTFNVRAVPVTEGLQRQRKLSLPVTDAWWKDCLERGYVFRSRLGLEEHFAKWHEEIATELLFASYSDFAERKRERHPLSRETLGRFLKTMSGCPRRLSNAAVGEHIVDEENKFGGFQRKAKQVMHPRPAGYHFGSLDLSRKAFIVATGLPVVWEPPETLSAAEEEGQP